MSTLGALRSISAARIQLAAMNKLLQTGLIGLYGVVKSTGALDTALGRRAFEAAYDLYKERLEAGPIQILRPLVVGLVHGLAGSAVVALLVLALIKNPWWAIAYLMLFGIGTIAGMMLITAAIGAVLAYASQRSSRIERHMRFASGLLSLGFGLFLAYQIVVVDGLITGQPGAMP